MEEAEDFALNDYSVALLRGSRLTANEETRIAKRVSELSGRDEGAQHVRPRGPRLGRRPGPHLLAPAHADALEASGEPKQRHLDAPARGGLRDARGDEPVPQLKVLLQSDYYDMGTPFFASELTFDHMRLEPERSANVTTNRYEEGPLMYVDDASLAKMRTDLVQFLSTLRGRGA